MRRSRILERKAGEQQEEGGKMTVGKEKSCEECRGGQEGGGDELLLRRTRCSHIASELKVSA